MEKRGEIKKQEIIVTNKKELLAAVSDSYFFEGETTILLNHKNGTATYKIYVPLQCFEKVFKKVLGKIKRTHSKYFA